MPKSLTVSQLLGEGSSHWETRSHRPCTSHWGARTGRKAQEPGLPGGEHLACPRGMVGRPGKVFAWRWAGPSPVRSMGQGHSGENSISGKTGIHFKISAQKGQQGCSQARQGPQLPQFFPRGLQPHGGPWPESAGRHHICYGARAGGACPHHSLNRVGVGSERACQQGTCPWTALCALPACPRHLFHIYVGMTSVPR